MDVCLYGITRLYPPFAVGPPQFICSKSKHSEQDLAVPGKLTAINTVLTVICFGIPIGVLSQLMNPYYNGYFWLNIGAFYLLL